MSLSNRLQFTQDEKEIFCSLSLQDSSFLKNEKKSIAKSLAHDYLLGSEHTVRDADRALKYENIANEVQEKEIPFFSIEYFRSLITTGSFYTITGWFTSIRLFLVRANKISSSFDRAFLPSLFSIGGLSYALTLSFDLGCIIGALIETAYDHAIDPSRTEAPLSKKLWWTFKNVAIDEGRLSNIANDAVWLGINLAGFILTGGIIGILNISGFVFDLGHEIIKAVTEYKKYDNLTAKIIHEIKQDQVQINELQKNISQLILNIKKLSNEYAIIKDPIEKSIKAKEIAVLKSVLHDKQNTLLLKKGEVEDLNLLKSKVEKETEAVIQKRLRIVLGVTIAFVGMLIILYPPAGLPLAALIGSSLALVGGSIMIGLGKRLFDLTTNYGAKLFNVIKSKLVTPSPKKLDLPKEIDHIPRPSKKNSYTSYLSNLLPRQPVTAMATSAVCCQYDTHFELQTKTLKTPHRDTYTSQVPLISPFSTPGLSKRKK